MLITSYLAPLSQPASQQQTAAIRLPAEDLSKESQQPTATSPSGSESPDSGRAQMVAYTASSSPSESPRTRLAPAQPGSATGSQPASSRPATAPATNSAQTATRAVAKATETQDPPETRVPASEETLRSMALTAQSRMTVDMMIKAIVAPKEQAQTRPIEQETIVGAALAAYMEHAKAGDPAKLRASA